MKKIYTTLIGISFYFSLSAMENVEIVAPNYFGWLPQEICCEVFKQVAGRLFEEKKINDDMVKKEMKDFLVLSRVCKRFKEVMSKLANMEVFKGHKMIVLKSLLLKSEAKKALASDWDTNRKRGQHALSQEMPWMPGCPDGTFLCNCCCRHYKDH
jgi:hypothetical protein